MDFSARWDRVSRLAPRTAFRAGFSDRSGSDAAVGRRTLSSRSASATGGDDNLDCLGPVKTLDQVARIRPSPDAHLAAPAARLLFRRAQRASVNPTIATAGQLDVVAGRRLPPCPHMLASHGNRLGKRTWFSGAFSSSAGHFRARRQEGIYPDVSRTPNYFCCARVAYPPMFASLCPQRKIAVHKVVDKMIDVARASCPCECFRIPIAVF